MFESYHSLVCVYSYCLPIAIYNPLTSLMQVNAEIKLLAVTLKRAGVPE